MKPIEKMSYNELIETHERQKKMIANRGILQKLPDKGEKLKETNKKIEAQILELEKQQKVLCEKLAAEPVMLPQPKIDVDIMEWTKGKEINAKSTASEEGMPEKDVEEEKETDRDIVNILGQMSIHEERMPRPSSANSNQNLHQDKFYEHLMEKVEHLNQEDKKYHTNKTLKHEKVTSNVLPLNWQDTNVTPPLRKFNHGAVPIHLDASLNILIQNDEKLKELELERSSFRSMGPSATKPPTVDDRNTLGSFLPDPIEMDQEEEEVYDDDTEVFPRDLIDPNAPRIDAD